MHFLYLLSVFILASFPTTYGWDDVFKYNPCYEKRMDERMPLTIDNLIAIIEDYEKDEFNTAPDTVANAILNRYRRNGVVYKADVKNGQWVALQYDEYEKQNLDDKLLKPSKIVPADTFAPREECSLHMMTSHSIDLYPHAGVDYIWKNMPSTRVKRSYQDKYQFLPQGVEPADHPVEFGVIQTAAGPIAGGLLLAGIMTMGLTREYTVEELIGTGTESEYMPSEMLSKKLKPRYGATIAGELAQAALITTDPKSFEVGPIGMFGNCTSCSRIFSLKTNDVSYLSRAEVFGALDGLIIANYMQQKSSSQAIRLSEILRMYYGDHGLFNPNIRACNRQNIFNKNQGNLKTEIQTQALNYMYALQDSYSIFKTFVEQNYKDFTTIETQFMKLLDPVLSKFNSFLSSYSYDDPGYFRCPKLTTYDVKAETQVDLVTVYSPSGSPTDIEKQLQYIGLTARKVGVGYHRSRFGVLNGRTEKYITPMTNHSNIADYVCNYTTYITYQGSSSQDFVKIISKLTELYEEYYSRIRSNLDHTGRNSQVVLWNLPSSFDGNEDDMRRAWNTFNLTYPDVTFIFAGQKDGQILPFYKDNKNDILFVSTQTSNPVAIANEIVKLIQKAPRMFVYPACNTLIEANKNYKEGNHLYTTYVSPNYTTYIRIPPQNFFFSEKVKLMIKDTNAKVCLSRINKEPSERDDTEETLCKDPPFDYTTYYLCKRYIEDCAPIYISVLGNSDTSNYCTDEECVYPNQVKFEMTHEGMICGSWSISPMRLILGSLLLFIYMTT